MYEFKNIGAPKNTDSGVAEFLLFAPVEWFTEIKSPAAPFNKRGDKVTIKTPHLFKAPAVPNITASAGAVTKTGDTITAIAVAIGGSGYVTPPAITITGGSGTGAAATAILTDGVVTSVVITNAGTGYTGNPTVTFAAPPVAKRGFAKFILLPQKNKLNAKSVGDLGANKSIQEAEFFIGGSYAEVHEAMQEIINTPGIALFKDSNCDANMYYQLGCDCQYAWVTVDFATETTKDGVKGFMGKIFYDGPIRLYIVENGPELLA